MYKKQNFTMELAWSTEVLHNEVAAAEVGGCDERVQMERGAAGRMAIW
jgi:hypothetical protein